MQRAGRLSLLARQPMASPFSHSLLHNRFHTSSLAAIEAKSMKVLWGSQTGTATGLADDLARELTSAGIAASSLDLRKYNPKKLATEKEPLVLVMACYGTGEPTDNAKQFYDYVMSKERKNGSLKDVQYAVFGLGQSKAYPACYQAVGRAMDKRLEELGAKRFFERGEGDDSEDVEADFTTWKEKLLQSVSNGEESDAAPTTSTTTSIKPEAPSVEVKVLGKSVQVPSYKRNAAEPVSIINPIEAQILENVELQTTASDRSTRHVEIDLANSDIKYETGDYLGVFPMNDDKTVDDLLHALNIDGDEVIAVKSASDGAGDFSAPRTIRQHLTENVDLTGKPRKSLFARLSAFATDPETQQRLSSEDYIEYCTREKKGFYHIVKENSLKLGLEHLLSLTSPLLPRYYSIASSPRFKDGRMQLTVGLAKTKTDSGADHFGVCSQYIHELKPGQKVRMFVKTSLFRLPKSPETPIIMVAAGCGIAPFHGFMQERKIQCDNIALPYTRSKNVLYFGVYNKAKDFLYEPEFRAYEKDGLLKLRMAFSEEHAPNQPPTFAQHRMMEDMQDLWQLIDKEEANTYVCGHTLLLDGVKEALQRTFTEVGGVPAGEVNERITKLQNSGRLQVDVY